MNDINEFGHQLTLAYATYMCLSDRERHTARGMARMLLSMMVHEQIAREGYLPESRNKPKPASAKPQSKEAVRRAKR